MPEQSRFFIGGDWVEPAGTELFEIVNPSTEEVLGRVPAGAAGDIDRAVSEARGALTGEWASYSQDRRAEILAALAVELSSRQDDLATLITQQNGCPMAFSLPGQVLGGVFYLNYLSELTRGYQFDEVRQGLTGTRAHVLREPVGVVAAIVPWNAPLLLALLKVGPALATGCTVIVKPSPETPLDSYLLADSLRAAGVPAGVVNIVPADRAVGELLVTHPGVDKVAFTGSTEAGKRIGALCGERVRRVTLELGGKSAAIVCEDADLSTTIPGLVGASTMINGQACVAQSRILVPRGRYQEVSEAMAAGFKSLTVGDPMDSETVIGPLVAKRQLERAEKYIAGALEQGARVAVGGERPPGYERGWYILPTLLIDVDNSMTIAREEVFAPVACLIPYDHIDEAIEIANDSDYGLSGTIWTSDVDHAMDIARQVRTGTLTVNGFIFEFNCPFGGMKSSGLGREMGPEGLDAYVELKCVSLPPDGSTGIFGDQS